MTSDHSHCWDHCCWLFSAGWSHKALIPREKGNHHCDANSGPKEFGVTLSVLVGGNSKWANGPTMAIRFLLQSLFLDHLQFSTKLMLSHVDLLGIWRVSMTKDFRMGHQENVSQCLRIMVPPHFWSIEMSWGIWMNWACILADGFINHTLPSPLSALENRAPNDTKL